jgi:hypothetical protein
MVTYTHLHCFCQDRLEITFHLGFHAYDEIFPSGCYSVYRAHEIASVKYNVSSGIYAYSDKGHHVSILCVLLCFTHFIDTTLNFAASWNVGYIVIVLIFYWICCMFSWLVIYMKKWRIITGCWTEWYLVSFLQHTYLVVNKTLIH